MSKEIMNETIQKLNDSVEKREKLKKSLYKASLDKKYKKTNFDEIKNQISVIDQKIVMYEHQLSDNCDGLANSKPFKQIPLSNVCSILSKTITNTNYSIKTVENFIPNADEIIKKCSVSRLKYFVDKCNFDVFSFKDKNSYPLIYLSAAKNRLDIYEYLQSIGCKMDTLPRRDFLRPNIKTILQAAITGNLEIVHESWDQIKDQKVHNDILYNACWNGHKAIVQCIIECHNVDPETKCNDGKTPLHIAADSGQYSVIDYLISKGANIETKNKSGNSPLFQAVIKGDLAVARFLISKKADLGTTNSQKQTLLEYSIQSNNNKMIELLISNGMSLKYLPKLEKPPISFINDIFEACKVGNFSSVLWICQNKTHDESSVLLLRNKDNDTPIHIAAKYGHLHLLRFLIEHENIDVEIKGNSSYTPLIYAIKNNDIALTNYLITKKAEKEQNFDSPIFYAITHGSLQIVKTFVEQSKSFDIEVHNSKNQTPLQVAAKYGDYPIFKYLIDHKATTNVVDSKGNHLIHFACKGGNLEIIKFILKHQKIDIEMKGAKENTPLIYACKNDSIQLFEYLLSKGAKPLNSDLMIKNTIKKDCEILLQYLIQNKYVTNINEPKYLNYALSLNHTKMATLLMSYGLNYDKLNEYKILGSFSSMTDLLKVNKQTELNIAQIQQLM